MIAFLKPITAKEVSRNANAAFIPVYALAPMQYNTMTVSLILTSLLAAAEDRSNGKPRRAKHAKITDTDCKYRFKHAHE